jgi:hypothetical protein
MMNWKALRLNGWILAAISFLVVQNPSFADSMSKEGASQEMFEALPLTKSGAKGPNQKFLSRYGVPFVEGTLKLPQGGSAQVDIGAAVKRIFFLGMTDSANTRSWFDPRDYSSRFFVGDELGQIRLNYADGSTQVFPLLLGEGVWWGKSFYQCPEPFLTDTHLRKTFAAVMRLYPPAPVMDGEYVAVIAPKPSAIQSITITNSPAKMGGLVITGITIETVETNGIAGATAVSSAPFPPEFEKFVKTESLRPLGEGENQAQRRLNDFRRAFYDNAENFHGRVASEQPPDYSGPKILFKGDLFAKILANAFSYNVRDMTAKIDEDGIYHTSTKGALFSWGAAQYGTFRTNVGRYYDESWCRDMGRSLQELTVLDYTNDAGRCADYCLRTARLWEEQPLFKGMLLPRHWGRIANKPKNAPPFENDGQGLVTMFLYKLWQRLPDRDQWLRSRWPDVKGAGDWILWQFDHPEISGATNGVLHTTGECAAMDGYSVYADYACMNALRALAEMADSIGETNSSAQWRDRAGKMRKAIADQYIVNDPKYGRVWTLDFAGWPDKSTVLGPLIFLADYEGFAPEDDDPEWRPVNEAAYQRLIDTYKPFGFYGQAMGYGQGFVTESALLLDRMRDASQMLDWAAKQIYDPRFNCFIVPEGVQIDQTGHFWFRTGDLGNGVQEAEIVKTLRLVIGVDDTQPNRIQFYPRMPYGWNEISVEKYPVLFEQSGKMETTFMNYKLERSGNKMNLQISSGKDLGPVATRLGPFENQPEASNVRVNGKIPAGASVQRSGDSWWVRFTLPVGPEA